MTAPPSPSSVLLVLPDEVLAKTMATDLRESGYDVLVVHDFGAGLREANAAQPSLIVIDRMLGNESGLKLCQQLRRAGHRTPVLILMARDGVDDRAACLESGADDYCLKTAHLTEFLQRLNLYLKPNTQAKEQLRFEDLVLDLATRRVLRRGRIVELTMKEFELLRYLMEHPREVLTREQILENVWGYDFLGESNVIEVYIRYLRLKIEDEGDKRLIQTVRGVGYVLRES
jgi:two-component system, OmpR family, response regulator NblR